MRPPTGCAWSPRPRFWRIWRSRLKQARQRALAPAGADPHSYEPICAISAMPPMPAVPDERSSAEQRSSAKRLRRTRFAGVVSVAVAEMIEQHGALKPLLKMPSQTLSGWGCGGGQNESALTGSSDAGMRFEVQSVRARNLHGFSNAVMAFIGDLRCGGDAVRFACARGVNLTVKGTQRLYRR